MTNQVSVGKATAYEVCLTRPSQALDIAPIVA